MTAIASGIISTCAGVGGGWTRIAKVDVSAGIPCPSGWGQATESGVSFCRKDPDGINTCSSAFFSTNGTSYQRVCGRARGYQKGRGHGFFAYHSRGQGNIDSAYVDGLSITHSSPRQHIWTNACGEQDVSNFLSCPCTVNPGPAPPPFVNNDWYCESGAYNTVSGSTYFFEDPLWDGYGCITSNCCNNSTQPWFYRELDEMTSSNIEARICTHYTSSLGTVVIDLLELYIQ